ncbi:MAG: hypothetical protein N2053_01105, partial [Chitinispirillaceae bacterium]|nr:hypothetical protein [Chitinispirillaceae bacterium]
MIKKIYTIFFYSLLIIISLTTKISPQINNLKKEDSLLSRQKIEEIISFLEDSQKVAELKRQLKLIADMKSITQKKYDILTFQKTIGDFSIFIKNIPSNWRLIFYNVKIELKNLHIRIKELLQGIQNNNFYYKIILAFGSIFFIITILLRKKGSKLLNKLRKESTIWQKLTLIISLMLKRVSSAGVLTLSFLFLVLFTETPDIQIFFVKLGIAIIIYAVFNTLTYLIFSPQISFLGFAKCSNSTLETLKKHIN